MESKEIIYYCEQGDPYCQKPKCRCNTVRPEKVKEQPNQGQSLPIDNVVNCSKCGSKTIKDNFGKTFCYNRGCSSWE